MSQSNDEKIECFHSVTKWTDRQKVIDYLNLYEWDLTFAVEAFYSNPVETPDDESDAPMLRRANSREIGFRYKLADEFWIQPEKLFDKQQQQTSANYIDMNSADNNLLFSQISETTDSSQSLSNSLESTQIERNVNTIINASNIESLDNQVEKIFESEISPQISSIQQFDQNRKNLLRYIDSNVVGKDIRINTPWGSRQVIYADYTASGRSLFFIEEYMLKNVLPYYTNTHSEISACARQIAKFREGSRKLIKRCVNANKDDVVIFISSGSTAAINKLVNALDLKNEESRNKFVVFISAFEHDANILPWKETKVELVQIPNTDEGIINSNVLETQLKYYNDHAKKQIICSFNAASNVTGIQADVDSISTLVHRYNGWIFWDYATAAPYVKIDMNSPGIASKDAVFISVHKFIGGTLTPDILVAKKKLFQNKVPVESAGGTIQYVEYAADIETREEDEAPNILGSIRTGLVFHLKESVGYNIIDAREKELVEKCFRKFRNHQKLIILGSTNVPRLAIFSFLIYVPMFNKYLHHNFVAILLNDLFGIQVRSGCTCPGPHVLDLLNIDDQRAKMILKFLTTNDYDRPDGVGRLELVRPGFTRINLSYFANVEEVDYILNAIDFIAHNGWQFLPLYTYNPTTAIWHTRHMQPEKNINQYRSLQMITFNDANVEEKPKEKLVELYNSGVLPLIVNASSDDPFEQAKEIAKNIPKYVYDNIDFRDDPPLNISDAYQDFIWFLLPKDVIRHLTFVFENGQNHDSQSFRLHTNTNSQ